MQLRSVTGIRATLYHGMRLRGRVVTTYLRGEVVFDRGGFGRPLGRCLRRGGAGEPR